MRFREISQFGDFGTVNGDDNFSEAMASSAVAKPAALPLSPMESLYVNFLGPLVDYLATSIPPGPQCLRMRWIINFQKVRRVSFQLMQ